MKKLISSHSHLLASPKDLDSLADTFSQIWLLGLPESIKINGYSNPASEEEMIHAAKQFPGLYLPFKWVDFRAGADQIDRAVDQGFVGFKAIYPWKPYDDESYLPIYERIASYHCTMVFHTGYVFTPPYKERAPECCYQVSNMRPAALYTLANLFPEITFVAAHFGIPWENELLDKSICGLPNLYIDLSGGHSKEILKIVEENAAKPARLYNGKKGIFADKFLLGLDAYLGHPQLHADVIASCETFVSYFEQKMNDKVSWSGSIPGILSENASRIMQQNHLL